MGAGLAGRPPCLPHSQTLMGAGLAGRPPCLPHSQARSHGGGEGGWAPPGKIWAPPLGCPPWHFIGVGIEVYSPPLEFCQPPLEFCQPPLLTIPGYGAAHSQTLMVAGLAGRPPCIPHSQVLMGAGLARRPQFEMDLGFYMYVFWSYVSQAGKA